MARSWNSPSAPTTRRCERGLEPLPRSRYRNPGDWCQTRVSRPQPKPAPGDPRREVVKTIEKLGLKLSITPVPPNVGTITMADDHGIVLHLRSLPPRPIAETMVSYKPSDAKYKEMIDHVGGLAPGETKMLPPWP